MSALVISFATASLRARIKRAARSLKGPKKTQPGPFRSLIRADAENAVEELSGDLPEMLITFGPSEEWRNCSRCCDPIGPSVGCAVDHIGKKCWCMRCWQFTS